MCCQILDQLFSYDIPHLGFWPTLKNLWLIFGHDIILQWVMLALPCIVLPITLCIIRSTEVKMRGLDQGLRPIPASKK